ncbi:major facilitator superfamily domain-containing protein [Gautieria morchelliformis]|nr:major facilitator superfamily domain-containing protein [Gautieria morchelliformis]
MGDPQFKPTPLSFPTHQVFSFPNDHLILNLTPASPQVVLIHPDRDAATPSYTKNRRSRPVSARPSLPHRSSVLHSQPAPSPGAGRGRDFWLVFVAVCSSTFLEALDFTTVSTALPTMVNDLQGADKFTWIGTAYTLSSTAFQPLCGALADIFGRRPCMLGSLTMFALGSAVCGAAKDMPMLIAGRTVQGVGAAGIGSLTDIIVADLVPLKDRGTFMGILAAIWAVASAIGPSIGGLFSEKLSWRWLFYINLPLTAFSIIMVFFFLKLKTPSDHILHKLSRVDWLGNIILIVGATAAVLALTWGGATYPWLSYQVGIPLIGGIILIIFFFYYEWRWAREPSVPYKILENATSLSGYMGTFFHGILATAIVYYLPLYFQAVKSHSPLRSGVDMLELSLTIAPVAIFTGISVAVFNRYRIQNYLGWLLSIAGFALLSLIKADTHGASLAVLQLAAAVGVGILYASVTFPVLAPLGVEENAHALAFFMFVRTFSYTFGIGVGSTIMENQLKRHLPAFFTARFPPHQNLAYAAVTTIPKLTPAQRIIVTRVFAGALQVVWRVLVGVALAGLVSCMWMHEIPMSDDVDARYALDTAHAHAGEASAEGAVDVEMARKPPEHEHGHEPAQGEDGRARVSPRSPLLLDPTR